MKYLRLRDLMRGGQLTILKCRMQPSESRKLVIILRGPPGVGKTTIGRKICAVARERGRTVKMVNLDHGWLAHERPSRSGGAARYPELVSCPEDVIVVELAQGEPSLADAPGDGATRNPLEWINLVRPERQVFSFFLWAEWEQLEPRLIARREPNLAFAKRCFDLHKTDPLFRTFAERGGIPEQQVPADKTPDEICELVLRVVCPSATC